MIGVPVFVRDSDQHPPSDLWLTHCLPRSKSKHNLGLSMSEFGSIVSFLAVYMRKYRNASAVTRVTLDIAGPACCVYHQLSSLPISATVAAPASQEPAVVVIKNMSCARKIPDSVADLHPIKSLGPPRGECRQSFRVCSVHPTVPLLQRRSSLCSM